MRRIFTISILFGLLVAASHAQGSDNGYAWKEYSFGQQSGFVQGFISGQVEVLSLLDKQKMLECKPPTQTVGTRHGCLIMKWWASIRIVPDPGKILTTVTEFYADPRNLPVSPEDAVLISEMMAQGDPVSDADLVIIRQANVEMDNEYRQKHPQ
jgi:hypothetical protein